MSTQTTTDSSQKCHAAGKTKTKGVRCTAVIPSFDELPDSALVRQAQLVRSPKHPTRPAPLPFSAATFWRRVQEGTFPSPIKLSERITAWRVGDVRAWLAAQQRGETA